VPPGREAEPTGAKAEEWLGWSNATSRTAGQRDRLGTDSRCGWPISRSLLPPEFDGAGLSGRDARATLASDGAMNVRWAVVRHRLADGRGNP